ncbi:MAG: hypothetical protein JXX14_07985 [Deltaproteobacteria bacterium]|nr:hypothetical protein [Deltaproteobacteria bacterium]
MTQAIVVMTFLSLGCGNLKPQEHSAKGNTAAQDTLAGVVTDTLSVPVAVPMTSPKPGTARGTQTGPRADDNTTDAGAMRRSDDAGNMNLDAATAAFKRYREIIWYYNHKKAKQYFDGYADVLDCFYGQKNFSKKSLKQNRAKYLKHFFYNSDFGLTSMTINRLHPIRATDDEVMFLDWGVWSVEEKKSIHEKAIVMQRFNNTWRITTEGSRKNGCLADAWRDVEIPSRIGAKRVAFESDKIECSYASEAFGQWRIQMTPVYHAEGSDATLGDTFILDVPMDRCDSPLSVALYHQNTKTGALDRIGAGQLTLTSGASAYIRMDVSASLSDGSGHSDPFVAWLHFEGNDVAGIWQMRHVDQPHPFWAGELVGLNSDDERKLLNTSLQLNDMTANLAKDVELKPVELYRHQDYSHHGGEWDYLDTVRQYGNWVLEFTEEYYSDPEHYPTPLNGYNPANDDGDKYYIKRNFRAIYCPTPYLGQRYFYDTVSGRQTPEHLQKRFERDYCQFSQNCLFATGSPTDSIWPFCKKNKRSR